MFLYRVRISDLFLVKKFLFLLIFCFAISYPVCSYELRLHFATSYVEEGSVVAEVHILESLPQEVIEYIEEGIIVVLNYRLELREQKFLFDKKISSIYFSRKIYYDFIRNEYVVVFSEDGKEIRGADFSNLSKYIYEIDNINVVDYLSLTNQGLYYYRTRLSLTFINSYPYLDVFFTLIIPLRYRIKWLKSRVFQKASIL